MTCDPKPIRAGRYEAAFVEDGPLRLDGGAMFGIVPRLLWQRRLAPDAEHRVPLALRCLLLRDAAAGRTILVDTGMGEKWPAREAQLYGRTPGQSGLTASLAAHGLRPEDVTDVVLTHLHFDHAGGATRRGEDGRLVPTFPRARHFVQRRNLEWARSPSERDAGSYRAESFEPLAEHGVLELLDGPGELYPGLELRLSEGHTAAQQTLLVGGEGGLLYAADLLPTSHHLHPAWVMAYDLHPGVTAAEKRVLLELAEERALWVVFEHDAEVAAARVRRAGKSFEPAETLPEG
jgi:glyoxylase-like metal-dependent hydrolase (beta-lactamase superfamily II)